MPRAPSGRRSESRNHGQGPGGGCFSERKQVRAREERTLPTQQGQRWPVPPMVLKARGGGGARVAPRRLSPQGPGAQAWASTGTMRGAVARGVGRRRWCPPRAGAAAAAGSATNSKRRSQAGLPRKRHTVPLPQQRATNARAGGAARGAGEWKQEGACAPRCAVAAPPSSTVAARPVGQLRTNARRPTK